MNRYARQISVPEFGTAGQKALEKACVLVIGAGGLATPVLSYLAAAGMGELRIADPDVVDLSNLHRQTLFCEADIGRSKTQMAQEYIAALNSDVRVVACQTRVDAANIRKLANGANLILDCADSFAVSYAVSDYCYEQRLPFISASISALSGYVGGFCGGAPSLRAVFPQLPKRFGSCAADGVLGPVVGIIGALQAQMALAVLTQNTLSPLGQMVTVDAARFHFSSFRFDGAPEPRTFWPFIATGQITAQDWVVDLRETGEAALICKNALRLRAEDLQNHGNTPPDKARAVLCCRSGQRAWQGAEALSKHWQGPIALVAAGG